MDFLAVSETKNGEAKPKVVEEKAVEKKAVKGKRKGESMFWPIARNYAKCKQTAPTESDSPIPRKLQKGTKKTIAKEDEEKPAVTKAAKSAKSAKKTEAPKGEAEELEVGSASESEEEEVEVQTLVAELDPEDEDAPEEDAVYKPGQPVGKIPDVSQAVEKVAKSKSDGEPGVIYIGRIPHGFYEHEMRQYFSQFGPITKLRLSRNKRTGASKHFAFIEFAESTTAEIVSKTMNNYLLFGHILKCRTISKEQVHDDLFKGANRRFKKVPWNKIVGMKLEKPLAEAVWEKKVAREQSKRARKADKLKALGYEFDVPGLKDVPAPGAVPEEVEEEVKVIETLSANGGDEKEVEVEVKEKVMTKPAKTEVEKSISVPKTKSKGAKSAKSKKAKA